MTIEFINTVSEELQPKIQQIIYTGAKFSPKLDRLLQKVLKDGNVLIQEVPSGTLAEASDWNNLSRIIRIEHNDSSLLNFIYQLSKAGNFHFKHIKSPSEFFTANEYANYVEAIHFVSNTLFFDILSELKPYCAELELPFELVKQKLELYEKKHQRDLLDSMLQQNSQKTTFSHADIYCAQWDKFVLIEKIRKINEILRKWDLDDNHISLGAHNQSELQSLFDSLYELCSRLEFMDFLSDYSIPANLSSELLTEIDSLQPAMQLTITLDEMNTNIERLKRLLPEKASTEVKLLSTSHSNELLSSTRVKLENLTTSSSSALLNLSKRQFLVSRDLYKDRDNAFKSKPNKISTLGFEFDTLSQLTVVESDYRTEFINSLSDDDDLLREFQIAYFDDLLANYRINCIKATEGKTDFVKDSQDEVIDLNLLTRQIIPKNKLIM